MLFNQNQMGRMIGQYMISQGNGSANPRVSVYDVEVKEVGTFTVINNLSTSTGIPTAGNGNCFRFNPNGTTLAVAYSASPYIYFFNKVGNAYTKLTDLSGTNLPNKGCQGISWHPSGKYLAAVFDANNNIGQCVVYERTADSFTTITNTASFSAAITATIGLIKCAWNPQGDTLALVTADQPRALIYSFNETAKTFTKVVNPFDSHPTARCDDVAWNNSGTSIALAAGTSPFIYIYNRNSTASTATFTKLANPTLPSGALYGVSWGGTNSEYLVCNGSVSPYTHFYLRSGNTFMKAANPATLGTSDGFGLQIDTDGRFVVSSHFNANTQYFRRDAANTNTWVNIGPQTTVISGTRAPTLYPTYTR